VSAHPEVDYFKPRGIALTALQEIQLTVDEFEALRLADLEELYQEDAAKRMNVSRQTFGNIIASARKKTADALVHGKALKIEGGAVRMAQRHFLCPDCNNEWAEASGTGRPAECPRCRSKNFHRAPQDRGHNKNSGSRGHGACKRGEI